MGVPVVIGEDNLPSPVGIGFTDLPNIGGPVAPLAPPGSAITVSEFSYYYEHPWIKKLSTALTVDHQ